MHVNGGSAYSTLSYDIYADGNPTGIKRYQRTDGSHMYVVTDDVLAIGSDRFDILASRGAGMREWVLAHIKRDDPVPGG
jgi:hypothetical protein